MSKKRIETKTPSQADFKADPESICIGEATLPYCPVNLCWMLPGGPKQKVRMVKSRALAVHYATELHQHIRQQKHRLGRM